MNFHLDHTPEKPAFTVSHDQGILMIGSCFAENIGQLLLDHKFNVKINPNGILFNPYSIYNCLRSAIKNAQLPESLILQRDNIFYSFDHHSSVNAQSKTELIGKIDKEYEIARRLLSTVDFIIITFGSAHVFELKDRKHIVANCHKQNQSLFEKRLLTIPEITNVYSELVESLTKINPGVKIIFTVSPVKYLKDGVEQNNLSKATLLLGANHLVGRFSNCYYFPAFELVNDDLRDYRFYKEDLAHPNDQAIKYVWDKFSQTYFSEKTIMLNRELHKLNQALRHRVMGAGTEEKLKLEEFISRQKEEIRKLMPHLSL